MIGPVGSGQAGPVAERQQHTHTVSSVKETVRHADTISNAGSQWVVGCSVTPSP